MDHLYYLCLVVAILSRLSIAALWSPTGKGLTSWLLFVMFNCVFVTFPSRILGQVWHLIVSILDLCRLSYFYMLKLAKLIMQLCEHGHKTIQIGFYPSLGVKGSCFFICTAKAGQAQPLCRLI